MDRILGHLAQFGSFAIQGELLCTQGLAFLLKDPDRERVFCELLSAATGHSISPGLSWRAESRQEDGGRPDLEARDSDGHPIVKIEAKLGAPFGGGQLESYLSALAAGGRAGALVVLLPQSRRGEVVATTRALFGVEGAPPWRLRRGAIETPIAVISWEDVFEALAGEGSAGSTDNVGQLAAMYRVLNGDYLEPLTSDADVLAWRERAAWWETVVDLATRRLTPSGVSVLPMGSEGGAHPYRRRYVCRPSTLTNPCYSVGTRDPFQNHLTPVWLRFNKSTGEFIEILGRIEGSPLGDEAVRSQGHLWFPVQVPLNSGREQMIASVVTQVQRILDVAYSEQSGSADAASGAQIPAAFPDHIRTFVEQERWTFAKTMPEWPHEYLVRDRVDETLFEETVRHIRSHGYEGRFYHRIMTYFDEDDWVYWTMGAPVEETVIINRCRKEDSYQAREAAGTLPG